MSNHCEFCDRKMKASNGWLRGPRDTFVCPDCVNTQFEPVVKGTCLPRGIRPHFEPESCPEACSLIRNALLLVAHLPHPTERSTEDLIQLESLLELALVKLGEAQHAPIPVTNARRDRFVAAALTGLMASDTEHWHLRPDENARTAVEQADLVLKELDE